MNFLQQLVGRQYQAELEAQIQEKKLRKEREKREQEAQDARRGQGDGYDYIFGRRSGGGGAPMRDADGNVSAPCINPCTCRTVSYKVTSYRLLRVVKR